MRPDRPQPRSGTRRPVAGGGGHIARKRFGQNFLVDHGVIDEIVRAIAPKPGEALVEIGPGLGALTNPVVERSEKLTVIELDRDLAARLRKRPELQVVESDVLKVDFAALAAEAGQKLRVIGNLPCCQWPSTWSTSTSCCKKRWWTAWWPSLAARTTAA